MFFSFLVCSRNDIEKLERGMLTGKLYSLEGSDCLNITWEEGGREHLWGMFWAPCSGSLIATHGQSHRYTACTVVGRCGTPACLNGQAEWRLCSPRQDAMPCRVSAMCHFGGLSKRELSVCQLSIREWKGVWFTVFCLQLLQELHHKIHQRLPRKFTGF